MSVKLSTKMSNQRLRVAVGGHHKLLLLDPETQHLAPGAMGVCDALKAADREFEDALDSETIAEYVALAVDDRLDRRNKAMSDAEYNACNRNRNDPRYKAVFPKGQADVTVPRLWDQLTVMDAYFVRWQDLAANDTVLAESLPKIKEDRDRLDKSLVDLKAASERRALAEWNDKKARMTAVTFWDSSYGELMRLFPGNRQRVESYFPRLRSRSIGEEDQTVDESEVDTGTEPGNPGSK